MAFLTERPIDSRELLATVQSPERGGIAAFLGMVRNHHGGRAVLRLEYSAYGPMAEAECARIVAEAERRWRRRGRAAAPDRALEIGDAAVAIVAASAHRDEAFAACRLRDRRGQAPGARSGSGSTTPTGRWPGSIPTAEAAARLMLLDTLRPPPPEPADLGHRPLQHALPVLHAGGGVRLAAAANRSSRSRRSTGWPASSRVSASARSG